MVHAVFVPGAGTEWQQIRYFNVADIRVPTCCHRLWIEHTRQSNNASAKANTMHYHNVDTTVVLPREALGECHCSLIPIYALSIAYTRLWLKLRFVANRIEQYWLFVWIASTVLCWKKHTHKQFFFYYTNIAFLIWWHWTEYFYFHPLFFYTLFISFTVFLLSGRFKIHFSPCFMPITTNNCTYRMESILCFCIDSLFLFLSSFPLSSLFVCHVKCLSSNKMTQFTN